MWAAIVRVAVRLSENEHIRLLLERSQLIAAYRTAQENEQGKAMKKKNKKNPQKKKYIVQTDRFRGRSRFT